MNAAANTCAACTGCRDNFPMPVAKDYFDQRVIADYTQRRTACTAVPAGQKPCLQPAPAASTSTQTEGPQRVGVDLVAPFGVYIDGERVAQYAAAKEARQHFDRLLAIHEVRAGVSRQLKAAV